MKPITILRKKARLGDQGGPLGTLAFYGPDGKKATKAVRGIFLREGEEATLYRHFSEDKNALFKVDIQEAILARMNAHAVRSIRMVEKILGCPHEEGIEYPASTRESLSYGLRNGTRMRIIRTWSFRSSRQEAVSLSESERAELVLSLMRTLAGLGADVTDEEALRRDEKLETGKVEPMVHEEFVRRVQEERGR